ncbi:MAG: HAD family phosphatase [Candidatus Aenigmarchaeota archaeon]|nr:HAD family phosphatase [Candidatus Aenigmarchaeota archaeon]
MRIEGAVFDLDGTLTDTEKLQFEGWSEVLRDIEVVLDKNKYFKYAGKTGTIVDRELIEDHCLDMEPGTLKMRKEKLLIEWLNSRSIELMPYALEAVAFFRNKSIPVAVATGAPIEQVTPKLTRTGLKDMFDAVVTRSDVKNGKPHPETYLKACKLIGIKPEKCVAFEDTLGGAKSAKDAGLICVAIPTELTEGQDFSFTDYNAKDLRDAIEWVKKKMD